MTKSFNKTYILFHYSFNNLAGTERVVSNLIETLTQLNDGRILLLLASKKKEMAIDVSQYPVELHYLGCYEESNGSSLQLLLSHLQLYQKAKQFFQHQSTQGEKVLIATHALLATVAYLANSRFQRKMIKFIACEHFSIHVTGHFSQIIRKLYYPYMTVVTLTEGDRKVIKKRFRPMACVCIPNASPFKISTSQYSVHHKTILAVGRFTYQKGFDLLVESFSKIAADYPDWTLKIIGDDFGDKALIQKMITERQIHNIVIEPSTKEIESAYQAASFFVLSSRYEGLPMVLIEAMSFGLPIVSFNCPTGPAEIVKESNGFLVENGNTNELAKKMATLMADKELLLSKSRGSGTMARLFAKEKINQLWKEIV